MSYNRKTFTYATSTISSSGDNTVLSGVSGKRIVIKDLVVQNESSTDTTVLIKNGSTTVWRALLEGKKAIAFSFEEGEELMLDSAANLVVNLSGANSHGYSIRYYLYEE